MMPHMKRFTMIALATLTLGAWANSRQSPTETTNKQDPKPGALLVVGGGGTPTEVLFEGLALTGSAKPRVVILPQASQTENRGQISAKMFADIGVELIDVIDPLDSTAEMRIANADLIWFPGGSQTRLSSALSKAKLVNIIHKRRREGAVIGGTSAGAAIMSKVMISGAPDPAPLHKGAMSSKRGLGLWAPVIVDQHFTQRDRLARLLTAVLDHPRYVGIGIAENTACIVEGDSFRVMGEGHVLVYDARAAKLPKSKEKGLQSGTGIELHLLREGDSWSLLP
ncbi:MAG TPA: cyanophycinase [Planctomycetes bacterium]|nr:cyanophycinase [Planctomycetota bacterium]HIL36706.1 cyanophycinase [Planctomycetota bacterium]